MRKMVMYLCSLILAAAVASAAVDEPQYKRHTRDRMALLEDGKTDVAVKELEAYLGRHPGDAEALYALAIARALKDQPEAAMEAVREALESGLPLERFLAGPRRLTNALTELEAFQALARQRGIELLHGPMLGCVTSSSAKFWVRTWHETGVQVRVSADKSMTAPRQTDEAATRASDDYTAVLHADGLKPDTVHWYQVGVDGEWDTRVWSFRTMPPEGEAAAFTVAFGGGAGYTPEHEYMWTTIANIRPRAFLFLGDNVYIDHPTYPMVQRYCYYRRQSRPEYRPFQATVPLYAIWDDHDFTTNDGQGGPKTFRPAWKPMVWDIYTENWNNPAYGGGAAQPGCWFDFRIGDVDFFMLDGRYYRENPRQDKPVSMLGPVQKAWLFDALKRSRATFKVLASPVPWAFGVKPGSPDPWQGFPEEREELFTFIEDHRIEGVVLISADRHRSDAWKIEREDGYDFYEFESSQLTNIHTHKTFDEALIAYNKKNSFGKLHFDTTREDPELTYTIMNIDGEEIDSLTVKRSALTFRGGGQKKAAARPEMLWADTSRKGRPFSKDPSVIRFGGRYLMYCSLPPGGGHKGWTAGIVQSDDLVHWKKVGEVLPEEPCEAKGLAAPDARVLGGKVHLFYQTYGNREKNAICHAWSEDGIHFTRNPTNPIFHPEGDWTVGRAIDAHVYPVDGRLLLYYATRDPGMKVQMLGVAAAPLDSDFGRDAWTQLTDAPILKPELPWEKKCIEAPTVCEHDGRLYMFYAGGYNNDPQQVGCAVSDDGIAWTRLFDQPLLPNGPEGAWNSSESGHPGVFVDEDGATWLFYQGNDDNGQTWLLSKVGIGWRDGKPYVK